MIKTFSDKRTEALFDRGAFRNVDKVLAKKARKQLDRVNAATRLEDFYFPPSNHFESLTGRAPTRFSIWINKQWRISFEWQESDAYEVLFEDYH